MNSTSIPFKDSINAQALEHENAMVDVYTKMKPDSFKSQLQAVLTTYYEDIKGVQGGSGCHKTRIVKRQFEDQEDDAGNEGADAADAGAGAGAVDACAGVADASAQLSAGAAGGGGGGEAPAALAQAPSLVWKAGAWVAMKKTT